MKVTESDNEFGSDYHSQEGGKEPEDEDKIMEIESTGDVKFHSISSSIISSNLLHPRFLIFCSQTLRICESNTYKAMGKILNQVMTQNTNEERLFFIHGPVGVGKSHALALYIVKQKEKVEWMGENMIFYVNNPHIFSNEYFFNELKETIKCANLTDLEKESFKKQLLNTFEDTLKSFKEALPAQGKKKTAIRGSDRFLISQE
jgi:hypothetical protein